MTKSDQRKIHCLEKWPLDVTRLSAISQTDRTNIKSQQMFLNIAFIILEKFSKILKTELLL